MWQKIWKMHHQELGGSRAYVADFEVYDDRSSDLQNTILDIYIGVKHNLKSEWIGNISIKPLLAAFARFEEFRSYNKNDRDKTATVQAFEYCFELVWKIMKRLLEERGKYANSPKETFRMAALEGFIEDPEIWFDFLKKRNLTVHTYNKTELESVVAISVKFSEEIKAFLQKVKPDAAN